ncbi:MAG: hypothetical protein M3042_10065 [Actinomycetota bacterium]|nr:hypothetical protein [Actinomycetota bacterium]
MRAPARLLLAVAGAAATRGLLSGARSVPACTGQYLERRNYRGRTVSLVAGPVLATVAAASAYAGAPRSGIGRAALMVGLVAGAAGGYDDIAGNRPDQHAIKGLRGHAGALGRGQVTGGVAKLVSIGAVGVLAARTVADGVPDLLVTGGVVAGTANLVNLLDLRPGRALKAAILIGLPLLAGPAGAIVSGPLGAAAAVLPDDLAERTMLGDTGANALGAIIGFGLAASLGRSGRAGLLAVLCGLILASERISFGSVIERSPGLRAMDAWGRRGPAATG